MAAKKTSSLAMVITLGLVAMLSGLLVVITWQLTLEPIEKNKRIMIEKAIFQVIADAQYRQTYAITNKGLVSGEQGDGLPFYAAFDKTGQLKGIAIASAAQGYAGMVNLLYGYDPVCECIRGFSIIKMAETPGLGDKILTDEKFLTNFKALDARIDSDNNALKNAIVSVKHGSKSNPWEVDAISGATITSKAVAKAINQSAQVILPKLKPYISQLIYTPVEKQE
ncbi:MAG: RnfABCDGE type electron transport complex subunit G [gamma proteobacterium symbiont of Taylorina sp.]|nr:RnfABCDGE type electron transport complex subunit G [gamma proteobacterium symbiont of Taylorina sp.]